MDPDDLAPALAGADDLAPALGEAPPLDPLAALAGGSPLERARAARVLGRKGGTRAVKALRAALDGRHLGVRLAAAEALARLDDAGAMDAVRALAADLGRLGTAAERARAEAALRALGG